MEEKGQIDIDSMNNVLLNNLISNRKWNLYFIVKHTLEMLRKARDYLYVIAKERESDVSKLLRNQAQAPYTKTKAVWSPLVPSLL